MSAAQGAKLEGIAFGGDSAVAKVELTVREGKDLRTIAASLDREEGQYGFRRWSAGISEFYGDLTIGARCTNTGGVSQPDTQLWNPSGYARNVVERIVLRVV